MLSARGAMQHTQLGAAVGRRPRPQRHAAAARPAPRAGAIVHRSDWPSRRVGATKLARRGRAQVVQVGRRLEVERPHRPHRLVDGVLPRERPRHHGAHVPLHLGSERRHTQIEPERDEEVAAGALLGVSAVEDLLDVLCDGGVGADALLVHQRDEIRLSQRVGSARPALPQVQRRRLQLLALVVRGDLAPRPLVVRVDLEVVVLEDHQPRGGEDLARQVELDRRLVSQCVARAASQEPTSHVLEGFQPPAQPHLVSAQPVSSLDRMYRRVGLVIVPAVAWPLKAPRLQRPGEAAPLRVAGLRAHECRQVEALLELVRLRPGVGQVALLVEPLRNLHGSVRWDAQATRRFLLQLDRAQRRRPPPLLLVPVDTRHDGDAPLHAELIQNQRALSVEQTPARPREDGTRLLFGRQLGPLLVIQLNLPKRLLRAQARACGQHSTLSRQGRRAQARGWEQRKEAAGSGMRACTNASILFALCTTNHMRQRLQPREGRAETQVQLGPGGGRCGGCDAHLPLVRGHQVGECVEDVARDESGEASAAYLETHGQTALETLSSPRGPLGGREQPSHALRNHVGLGVGSKRGPGGANRTLSLGFAAKHTSITSKPMASPAVWE
eukprot:scaffold12666_cov87-Isochrysis_galbana.AAC.1